MSIFAVFGRRSAVAGLAVSAILATCVGVLAQDGPESIVQGWIDSLDQFDVADVSHDGIGHNVTSGVTTIAGLRIKVAFDPRELEIDDADAPTVSYDIRVPELEFVGLAESGAYYLASAIRADGMLIDSVTGDGDDVMTSVMRFSEYEVDNVTWAKLPEIEEDPARPVSRYYPVAAAVFDFSFDGVEIGPVVSTNEFPDDAGKMTLTYGSVIIGPATNGDIADVEFDGVTLVSRFDEGGGDQAEFRMTMGPASIGAYNYGSLVRMFDPDAPMADAADNPYLPVISSFVFSDLQISGKSEDEGAQINATIDRFLVDDFAIRKPDLPVLAKLDELLLAAEGRGDEPEEEEIIDLVAALYGAMRLGLFELTDLKVEVEGQGGGELGSFVIRDLSADGLGEYSQKGIAINGPDGIYAALDEATIENVTFPTLSALINLEAAQENGDIAAILAAIPTVGRVLYSGIDLNVPGEAKFALAKGLLEMGGHIGPIPSRILFEIGNMRMPVDQLEADSREQLQALGYEEIDLSLQLAAEWDDSAQAIAVTGDTELVDGATIDLDMAISGIQRVMFENPEKAIGAAMFSVAFDRAELSFEDASLRDRVLEMVAAEQGADPETIKQMALGVVPFMLAALNRPEITKMVTDAVNEFFAGKGNLTVSANPPTPVPLMQIIANGQADPGSVVDALNLNVEAE